MNLPQRLFLSCERQRPRNDNSSEETMKRSNTPSQDMPRKLGNPERQRWANDDEHAEARNRRL